jgi:hypothetical protein
MFPHAIYPGRYRIQPLVRGRGPSGYSRLPGLPRLTNVPGNFGAPPGNDPTSVAVRIHEYAHIAVEALRIVPPHAMERIRDIALDVGEDVMQAVLDVIANTYARRVELFQIKDLPLGDYSRQPLRTRALAHLRYRSVPMVDPDALAPVPNDVATRVEKFYKLIASVTYDARRRRGSPGWTVESLAVLCREIEVALARAEDETPPPASTPSCPKTGEAPPGTEERTEDGLTEERTEDGLTEERTEGDTPPTASAASDPWGTYAPPKPQPAPPEEIEARKLLGKPPYLEEELTEKHLKADSVPWGRMEILTPKLDAFHRTAQVLAVRPVPGSYGPFRFPHRALPGTGDGKAFGLRGRRRARGGTILLDVSGSMHLDELDIDRLLSEAPAATVAMYSAMEANKGQLFIVASRGRRVRTIPEHGPGNVVDGPALRWLSRQRPPRVWITDGGVTGVRDVFTPEGSAECWSLCRRYRVRPVREIDAALRVLDAEARLGRVFDRIVEAL